jgi:hypothetical protein
MISDRLEILKKYTNDNLREFDDLILNDEVIYRLNLVKIAIRQIFKEL